MAREDEFEEQYLQEMPDCLHDLFEQTSSEQSDCLASSYSRNSTENYKSVLEISGLKLPPPPLTEEERSEMCHYRREAVKCEARLIEKRRDKYSDLIWQVMSVMDKIQEQKEAKLDIESTNGRTLISEMDEKKVVPCSTAPHQDGCKRRTWNVPGIRQSEEQESKANPMVDWARNQGNNSLKDGQLHPLCNSLESHLIGHKESRHFQGICRREVNTKEHPSDGRFILEAADQPLSSTMYKDLTELKRPFSHLSVMSEGVFCNNESDQTEINKQQEGKGPEFDSLSSTSFSVALSDFSNVTVCSTVESELRPTSQQHPDTEAEIVNGSHYKCFDKQQLSTTQMKCLPSSVKHSSVLFKSETSHATHASKGGPPPNQDNMRESLEKQRQNLLEDKQRQLNVLKQQELKRLHKQQKEQFVEFEQISVSTFCSTPTLETERPRSSSLPSTRSLDFKPSAVLDRVSPLRRPISMPVGKMHSILELSGESLDFESESSSDKENRMVNGNLSMTRNDAKIVLRNGTVRTNSGKNKHLSSVETGDVETSSLTRECFKVFPSNGRDKFAKLSAHAKGFLTRLLMKTDKIQGLVKNIKDTREVLEDLSKDGTQTVQEKMLMENVESHLKGARGSLHDVFFTIPIKERMSYIAHSRSLARAKHEKRVARSSLGHSKLSAVTLKAIQRRQEGLENSVRQTENPEIKPKPEVQEERKRKNWNIRVLKPQQCHSSPVLHERTRSQRQVYRPSIAPERQINSRHSKAETEKRPETAEPVSRKTEGPSRLSLGGGNINQNTRRLGRKSLGGIRQQSKMSGALGLAKDTVQPRAQKRLSLPAQTVQPRLKAYPGTNGVMKRPQTASEVRRTSRMMAANFVK